MKRLQVTNGERIVIGVSGGLDSTHALIVAAKAFDALGLPRKNILGFTMPGFATSEGTKSNAWALMNALGVTGEEIDIKPAAMQMLEGHRPSVREGRAGLRRHVRERAGGAAHRLSVPARQPAQGVRARHRRPVRARARLVHVRRRRPHEPLQRERLGREDADPVSGALGGEDEAVRRRRRRRRCSRSSTPRSRPSSCRPTRRRRHAEHAVRRSGRTSCRISISTTSRATACGRRRSRSSRGTRGATPRTARGRRTFPDEAKHAYTLADIKKWLGVFLYRFFEISQYKRSALPNGPKVVSGGNLSPRGDWRAPSDGNARVWLDELERNVPEEHVTS